MNQHLAVLALCTVSLSTGSIRSTIQEDEPPHWTLRRPAEFPDLPRVIRRQLEQQQCRIPQAANWRIRHNLVWGEFERKGQQDLAVLCVRGQTAVVYIYWAGDVAKRDRLRGVHHYQPGSWIKVAVPRYIEEHIAAYGLIDSGMPTHIEHDGVEDVFACCSSVYYRHNGRWLRAPGAD
jgi:hypothetical protein